MPAGDWVPATDLRREVVSEIFLVLVELEGRGWRLRRSGHKATLYCPCGQDTIVVPGTPRNPGNAARRITREASRCPDRHPSQ